MIKLGSTIQKHGTPGRKNIFFSRLKLLIIMAKAFLENYPLGEHRIQAMIRNSEAVTQDCIDWNGYFQNFRASTESGRMLALDHIFFQRVKLLAVMTKSFAESNPMGQHRRMAVRNNIDYICDTLGYVPTTEEIEMLKVA
ncbi:MAG: hypothetical protein JRI93_11505 [Deltaproteobacteria bacterium]|nr:hypothetical protein [Deltaproteobacteria bacterium]